MDARQFKRSNTAGKVPAKDSLVEGQLALNFADKLIFSKDDKGNIVTFNTSGKKNDLSGVVRSVNGTSPDKDGNVSVKAGDGSVSSVNGVVPDAKGDVKLEVPSINKLDASVYVTDKKNSSKQMNELIKKAQASGGGTIVLGDATYLVDISESPKGDSHSTGWLVPFVPGQGQANSVGVTFEFSAGTTVKPVSENMVVIRGSNNFTHIRGCGRMVSEFSNVIHVGFVPENMSQTTDLVSQQFCSVDEDMSFVGGLAAVCCQPGPTVNKAASGSYYHTIGMSFYNVSYPVWLKQAPAGTTDNVNTTVFMSHIRGNVCISAGKFESCDAHMQNCAFEGMTGEIVDFSVKGDLGSKVSNQLKISNCDFEVYKSATHMGEWGIMLGAGNKFAGGPDINIAETLSPIIQSGKQVYGSYGSVNVGTHVIEHVVGKKGSEVKVATILNADNGSIIYSETANINLEVPHVHASCTVDVKPWLKQGMLFNGTDTYAEMAFSGFDIKNKKNLDVEYTTSLRCYGGTDWRIGDNKLITEAPDGSKNYVRNNGSWVEMPVTSTKGFVRTVNDVIPGAEGNLSVTAESVGTYGKEELYTKKEVDKLIADAVSALKIDIDHIVNPSDPTKLWKDTDSWDDTKTF